MKTCPQCGETVVAGIAEGLCGRCLLRRVLPADIPPRARVPAPAPTLLGRFAGYELLEELARGGMGVVYKARQANPSRIIALKMVAAGALDSPDQIKRFETDANLTECGTVMGTPNYMAPEQASGKERKLSTAVDVYSLGAILYEGIAGQPPFVADTPLTTIRLASEQEPIRPSTINRWASRDLETICLKCLEKDPARRYESAQALAEDMERSLRHEPIHARPATPWEHTAKWARRNPALTALLAVAMIAPAIIIGVLLVMTGRVRAERNNALRHEQATRRNLYAADMYLVQHALDEGNVALARHALENHQPKPEEGAATSPKARTQPDLRGFEWRFLWQRCEESARGVMAHRSSVTLPGPVLPPFLLAPDGQTLAAHEPGGQ